jgi:hypothetical protein
MTRFNIKTVSLLLSFSPTHSLIFSVDMSVDWCGALSISSRKKSEPEPRHLPWIQFCKPTSSAQVRGNREGVRAIQSWFSNLSSSQEGNDTERRCLFVYGPSGVWKSTTVSLCASENGFHAIHTNSDVQRTPQRLEVLLREIERYSTNRGLLILDEFESFIRESSTLKWVSKFIRCSRNVPVVIVCNAIDKSFARLRDASTVVEFRAYTKDDTCATLLRLSTKISSFCHLPPMDCYFIANMCSGDVCHTVNQLNLMYLGTKPIDTKSKSRKRTRLGKVKTNCTKDSSLVSWSNTHRATSVEHFVTEVSLTDSMDSVVSMNRDFMISLAGNLFKEYPYYFHNSSKDTLAKVCLCAESLSYADCGGVALEDVQAAEDRLYESENSNLWGDESVGFSAGVCSCLHVLRGRTYSFISLGRKSVRKKFKFVNY